MIRCKVRRADLHGRLPAPLWGAPWGLWARRGDAAAAASVRCPLLGLPSCLCQVACDAEDLHVVHCALAPALEDRKPMVRMPGVPCNVRSLQKMGRELRLGRDRRSQALEEGSAWGAGGCLAQDLAQGGRIEAAAGADGPIQVSELPAERAAATAPGIRGLARTTAKEFRGRERGRRWSRVGLAGGSYGDGS